MGFGKMGKWSFFNIPLENVVKSMHKKTNSFKTQSGYKWVLRLSNIPSFHYSMSESKPPSLNKNL
jgi:hypothetical protein